MTNGMIVLIYLPLLLNTLILLVSMFSRNRDNRFVRKSFLYYAALLGWLCCYVLIFAQPNPQLSIYLMDFKRMFEAFSAVAIFLVVTEFYRISHSFPPWAIPAICVIPAITALLGITSPFHPFLTRQWNLAPAAALLVLDPVRGPWYYVHLVYSQVLTLIVPLLAISRFRRLPRAFRHGFSFLVSALVVFYAGAAIEFSGRLPFQVDATLLAAGIGSLLFYLATLANGRTDYLMIAGSEVFHYLDEVMFVLEADGAVVEMNGAARRLLEHTGAAAHAHNWNSLMECWTASGMAVRRQLDDAIGEDIYFLEGAYPRMFQLRSHPITEERQVEGRFVIMRDVTNQRLFVERLRETAGVDALTGLPNRYRYQQLLRQLDIPANLPLSMVVGDVNGLKKVNDTLGHYEGDMLLKSAADILRDCCPARGSVARIGGDEFVMLVPRCSRPDALSIIGGIQEAVSRVPRHLHRPSIALGCATKHSVSENLSTLFDKADMRMYDNKCEGKA